MVVLGHECDYPWPEGRDRYLLWLKGLQTPLPWDQIQLSLINLVKEKKRKKERKRENERTKEMVCTNGNQKLLFRSIYEGGGCVFRWVWVCVCVWVGGWVCVCEREKKNKTRSVLNGSHNCGIGLLPLNIKFKFIRKLNVNFNDNCWLFLLGEKLVNTYNYAKQALDCR